jgi:hypothetical protein
VTAIRFLLLGRLHFRWCTMHGKVASPFLVPEWAVPARAKIFLGTGTGDILGRRMIVTNNGTRKMYRYFVQTYAIMDSFCTQTQRRKFSGVHYKMDPGVHVFRSLVATMLTTFEGERPERYVAQHHAETWNNDPDKLDWFTRSDNNKIKKKAKVSSMMDITFHCLTH